MSRTGSRLLSVAAIALAAFVASGAPEAAAQDNNPVSAFFNAIFGGGRRDDGGGRQGRQMRPSQPVPNRATQPSRRSSASQPSRQRSAPSRSRSRPEPAAVAKSADAEKVVVFGDSFGHGLAEGLEAAFSEEEALMIVDRTAEEDGLVGAASSAWFGKVKAYLADPANRSSAAVVMVGGKDRQAIQAGASDVAFGTERWRDLYAQRVEGMMAIFLARGTPVYWVGLPPVAKPDTSADNGLLNEIYRARAYRTGADFIDIWNGFVDGSDAYAQSGPDLKGEIRQLREDNGVGFTDAGNRKLAHFVARELRRDLVSDGELVSTSLPDPEDRPRPYQPSDAMRETGRGEIVNLTSSPGLGGLLAGGLDEGPDAPDDSAYHRVIVEGRAPAPEPGRSDDFSWPRQGTGG